MTTKTPPSATNDLGWGELSSLAFEGDPSPAALAEMVVAERAALVKARAMFGEFSRTAAAHEATLRLLIAHCQRHAPVSHGSATPLEIALQLADIFEFDGPAVLKAFHVETLRPQAEFNRALVDVLRQLLHSRHGSPDWIRQRLGRLADPTAWRVKSHRSSVEGVLADLTKKSYLKVAGPLLERALSQQKRWNEAVIAVLEAWTSPGLQLRELEQLSIPSNRLLRRQARFNEHIVGLLRGAATQPATTTGTYPAWIQQRDSARMAAVSGALASCPIKPFFTLVVAGDGDVERTVASVNAQLYRNCEVIHSIAAAKGDWVGFLSAGDILAPHALAELVLELAAHPEHELIYADEDRLEVGQRSQPFFKPDFSPELLHACDYVSRFFVVRGGRYEADRGLYDLVWRVAERTQKIGHVAEILLTRTTGDAQRVKDFTPAKKPLEEHFQRIGSDAKVIATDSGFRVQHPLSGAPLVSVIVPFKDKPELLETLVKSFQSLTAYEHYELLLISNNSVEPKTRELIERLDDPKIRHLRWDHPFNYPAINNFGARHAKGELLLFLNNDIEIIDKDWLAELVAHGLRPEVGAVGPKLLFPDRKIQHAGVVVGMGGFAGHVFAGLPDDGAWTVFGTADSSRDYLAVTSACLLMRRELFEELGGFDEKFQLCGSDVDLCLRTIAARKQVIYTPYARLVHHEAATRRDDRIPLEDFWESFRSYRPYLRRDPFYNPNLSLTHTAPWLRDPSEPLALDAALQRLAEHENLRGGHALSSGRLAHSRAVLGMAQSLDFTSAELAAASRAQSSGAPRHVTWFLPFFDHPFGGVHTVFRFADLWRKHFGVESVFVIYDNPHVTPRELEAKVAMLFDSPPGKFIVLKQPEQVSQLPETDVAITTLWTGAYTALRFKKARHYAYFVQDFEPQFYAAGTLGALAENTYQLGFYGIFNSQGLHDCVTSSYPMKGTWFEPSVDHALFHAQGRRTSSKPIRLFFYGRPSTDRNGFELGIEALRKLKARFGADVAIYSAGEIWDPSWFNAQGVIENLGVLPYRETANLYRDTDVGLVLMFTRHPSYLPLEMMACGVTVVTNDNPANRWLLRHRENSLLFKPTVSCAAEQLIEAVENARLRDQLGKAAAERMLATDWDTQAIRSYEQLKAHVLSAGTQQAAS